MSSGAGWVVTSIERTAYPRFKRLITDTVVNFVRRALDLPEGTMPGAMNRTAERQRTAVRQRTGLSYDKARARKIAEAVMRGEAVSKNRPADLINIALEKVVEAGLELPGFTTLDALAAKVRTELNASICMGIYDQLSEAHRERLLALLSEKDESGTTKYNRLKRSAKAPTWSHFRAQAEHLGWVDGLGETVVWLTGVASGKITDFAGEADAADAPGLRDYNLVKRLALMVCLVHKARMRARDDLTTMFCKRVALQVKRAKAELESIREQQQAIEILSAVGELDQDTKADSVAARLGEGLGPALHTMVQALCVQAGALGVPAGAVDYFGGFAGQYEQIEKVAAHHGNYWEVLLYGHLLKDRSTMYDLTSRLELRATSEDSRVLDALAHARRYKTSRDYIPERHEDGRPVDISFATLNWQKAVRDKNRPDVFVRKHFEAKLGDYLVEVGLAAPGDETPYDAVAFRRQLEDKLTAAAAAADAGYPDNEGLVIDSETGIPSLKAYRWTSPRRGATAPRSPRTAPAWTPTSTICCLRPLCGTASRAASPTTTSPTPTSRCSRTSSRVGCGRPSTSSRACSRTPPS